jgi:hypothetical protein
MKSVLTAERLRELMHYNPLTGVFTNSVSRGAAGSGNLSGGPALNGYMVIAVDGKRLYAHRLAWLYMTGEWPKHHIDHINGIRNDNRIANLRDIAHAINVQNRRLPKEGSQTGVLGVRRMRDKFQARVVVGGKKHCIGTFDNLEEARNAYILAKRRLHEGCTL